MDVSETTAIVIVVLCLGVGLVMSLVGLFLFTNTDWWDKL